MSSFGSSFKVTTFGESHGIGVGCVIDGVPSNFALDLEAIQKQMDRRRPGQSTLTTKRNEADRVEILSGVRDDNVTLGTSLAMMVRNKDQRQFDYATTDPAPRPGHADYTYQQKYGVRAKSGGGRASARETLARVAAGAVAEQWLEKTYGTKIVAFVSSVKDIKLPSTLVEELEKGGLTREDVDMLGSFELHGDSMRALGSGKWYSQGTFVEEGKEPEIVESPLPVITRVPDEYTAHAIAEEIACQRDAGDSIGGVCTCVVTRPPVGLGEPVFDKTEALLAQAMMSLPATKGFEIGTGFEGTTMRGSDHNDPFCANSKEGKLATVTNHAGGTLGGITTGLPLVFRIAVKAVSSIGIPQETVGYDGEPHTLEVKGRHDPCVLPRVPPLVEGMTALVLADLALRQRSRSFPTSLETWDPIEHIRANANNDEEM